MQASPIVIDGNNIIFALNGKKGNLECLLKLMDKLNHKTQTYPIISHELMYRVDDSALQDIIQKYHILVTPANVDTDVFILETAQELGAFIISNDQYRQYKTIYPEVVKRRIPYMMFRDHSGDLRVILPQNWFKRGERS